METKKIIDVVLSNVMFHYRIASDEVGTLATTLPLKELKSELRKRNEYDCGSSFTTYKGTNMITSVEVRQSGYLIKVMKDYESKEVLYSGDAIEYLHEHFNPKPLDLFAFAEMYS
jgi:hypothetical protein